MKGMKNSVLDFSFDLIMGIRIQTWIRLVFLFSLFSPCRNLIEICKISRAVKQT